MGHVVSTSDFESFHLTLADGYGLCCPQSKVGGSEQIYTDLWLNDDIQLMADRIHMLNKQINHTMHPQSHHLVKQMQPEQVALSIVSAIWGGIEEDFDELDFVQWGGLRSETLDDSPIDVSDGVHIKRWKESVIIYRITNASLISESETLLVGFNAAISKRDEKVAPFFTGGGKATNLNLLSFLFPIVQHITRMSPLMVFGTLSDPKYQENLAEFIQQLCLDNNAVLFLEDQVEVLLQLLLGIY